MKVELLDVFGDDLMVVNAARVSYGKRKDVLDQKDINLLKYLVQHKHTSPFRHPQLQFRIEVPIFVERQMFKHTIGLTANSISGRYVDFADSYWRPTVLREQSKDSKQGSADVLDRPDLVAKMRKHMEDSAELYHELCTSGVAKEQARTICPLALHTQFIWTGSLAAYLHFWALRLKPDAQVETRDMALMMLNLVRETGKFVNSLEAFGLIA